MSKRLLAIISAICILCSLASCGNSEDSDTLEISKTESSSSEPTSSEDSSSEYIVDSSEDESSEVEKVTTKTPKKVEDSSSEDDNSSKVTTTKKTETPKTTTTKATQPAVTQAPVTQKPATTTKTTTQKPVTQLNGSHTHNWVKYREADGIKYYQCTICGELKEEGKKTTTTTKVQPTSKTVQPNEWIPVYNKTLVTHTIGDGYEKIIDANGYAKPGKKVEFVSKTYWNEAAANRGDATEIAKRTKAQDEARAFINRDDLTECHWVSSGNDHYIDVPDKYNIAFYYYKDSNGKYAISAGSTRPSITTESDLATKTDCYSVANNFNTYFTKNTLYLTGTPWAK